MKSRAVAGNLSAPPSFCTSCRKWTGGATGRAAARASELAQMRARLEKEQGSRNPLKAGRGGYYDIDFALMYLRLKGAGIFYKVLNTPERIDVIEKMGHLEREDADSLRDAAAFYRAIDQVCASGPGRRRGNCPPSQMQLEVLTELVGRWTPRRR